MATAIRLAKPADAPDMADVHARSWKAAYKGLIPAEYIEQKNQSRLALYQKIITEENHSHYVLQLDGKTVGIMNVALPQDGDLDESFYELHGLYLDPDFFHRGISTQAMDFAVTLARGLGKKILTVWVFCENRNAIHFYETCGFIAENHFQTYDCGVVLDCIRMRRSL